MIVLSSVDRESFILPAATPSPSFHLTHTSSPPPPERPEQLVVGGLSGAKKKTGGASRTQIYDRRQVHRSSEDFSDAKPSSHSRRGLSTSIHRISERETQTPLKVEEAAIHALAPRPAALFPSLSAPREQRPSPSSLPCCGT